MPKTAAPKDLIITLQRTMCPSACPDYSLSIYGDGKIVYEGRHYVAVKGRRETRISINDVKKLVDEFQNSGYFSFKDRYDSIINEGSITKTSIVVNGKTKQVVNCHPSQAPDILYQLENMIDEVVQSNRWVRRSGAPVLEP
jgi:hypothetical protein